MTTQQTTTSYSEKVIQLNNPKPPTKGSLRGVCLGCVVVYVDVGLGFKGSFKVLMSCVCGFGGWGCVAYLICVDVSSMSFVSYILLGICRLCWVSSYVVLWGVCRSVFVLGVCKHRHPIDIELNMKKPPHKP